MGKRPEAFVEMETDHIYQVATLPHFENDELFESSNEHVNDLHTYYMSQFNQELENSCSKNGKIDNSLSDSAERTYDLELLNNWNANTSSNDSGTSQSQIIHKVMEQSNANEVNIKDVLFDLDTFEFDGNTEYTGSNGTESSAKLDLEYLESNCDYIDDESLIDELCREDSEPYRLTPDIFNDSYLSSLTNDKNLLPSIETAFSKHYTNNTNIDQALDQHPNGMTESFQDPSSFHDDQMPVSSLEAYSYPNNVIYNINNPSRYILPDTPTSCSEFSFERGENKVSVSESIESSSCYDDNCEELDDEELFINLDEFGFSFEKDNEGRSNSQMRSYVKKVDKDKTQGTRTCLWEECYEQYGNQSSLVEHIERLHVNTYKGDEFSCMWRDCGRAGRPFNARYKLLIHMRVHSGHKPNRCHHPGCGKAFSRLENLKIHVRSHTGERPYACAAPHCRKVFSNSSDRAKHQRTHFNARPYACGAPGCGKRYTDPSSLRKHVKSHPHVVSVPRTCIQPARHFRKPPDMEQTVPTSPARLTTLRCIRDKLATVPRLQKL